MKLKDRIKRLFIVKIIIDFGKRLKFPGISEISLYDVIHMFFEGLNKGAIPMRASSISFNLFLGIFPALIFFFTLIPYIPIHGMQKELLDIVKSIIPTKTYESVSTTIEDIIRRPRGGLLSFGFIFALYVSSNGVKAMIDGFNQSYHKEETRTAFKTRIVAVLLVIIISFLLLLGLLLIVLTTNFSFNFLHTQLLLRRRSIKLIFIIVKWIVLVALCFFSTSFIYYFGPAEKIKWKTTSAGAVFATFLTALTYLGFNFYVNNFAKYNVIYGSIGTLIVILLWIYINSLVLLMGYELNASIYRVINKIKE